MFAYVASNTWHMCYGETDLRKFSGQEQAVVECSAHPYGCSLNTWESTGSAPCVVLQTSGTGLNPLHGQTSQFGPCSGRFDGFPCPS